MWLTGRLMPDFKTIANLRKDNSQAIRGVCRQLVVLCQQLGLFEENPCHVHGSYQLRADVSPSIADNPLNQHASAVTQDPLLAALSEPRDEL